MKLDDEYVLCEYKALREEMLERFKVDYAIQRNATLAAGAIIAFSFSNDMNRFVGFLSTLAASGIMFAAYLQSARMKKYGMRIGGYLAEIEKAVYKDTDLTVGENKIAGWENYMEVIRKEEKNKEKERGSNTIAKTVGDDLDKEKYSAGATKIDARFFIFGSIFIVIFGVVRCSVQ